MLSFVASTTIRWLSDSSVAISTKRRDAGPLTAGTAGTAATGREALDLVRRHTPAVLVTDIEMPGLTGLELAAQLRRDGARTRVLIVTTFDRPGYLRRALEAGVGGYLLKDTPSAELAEAVLAVTAG